MFPLSHMMKAFIKTGTLEVIDAEDKRHVFSGKPGPKVVMKLHDKRLYRDLVFKSEIAAAEGYMDGTMTFEEGSTLREFLHLFSINRLSLAAYPLQKALRSLSMLTRRKQQSNRVGQAQQNVAHHYDLGNEFYKLFLDKNMLYSCAYFHNDNQSLEQAQRNKLRLIAAKLNLKPGLKVLDIGCGWGDMALYLASMADVKVVGVTLSTEQQKLATERATDMGLSDRVEFRLQDYRELDEQFDRIVSVGMFEHVGVSHYDEFFAQLNKLMPDEGLALIHSIGHMSPPGMASKFMRKYIFPGAYSPALSEVFESVERNSLWCLDLEFLRVHYAKT
ncbi:MAG: cyclopropane-fatty-acyl-phospholipid synthase family protein, partial [Pseudomonadota bacterium]